MNENENIQEQIVEAPAVDNTEVTCSETKTGMSNGQKAAGLGILALALYGLYKLIRGAITGVKSLFSKGKKKLQEHKANKAAEQENEIDPDDIVEAEVLPDKE